MADLTFDGTDIHDREGIFFDVTSGFDGLAEVRGVDSIVPGKAGRTARSRVKDRRVIVLTGYVRGIGATLTAAQQDYRTNVSTIQTLFDSDDAAKSLVVTDPYLGLSGGATRTISARYLNAVWGVVEAGRFCRVSVTLEAVGDPPEWA